jgi:trigger factor
MKSTVEKLTGLLRKFTIQVPSEHIRASFSKAYKEIQKNATIKGFRKGKAPIANIRAAYGERVRQDVLNEIISEAYQKALDEHVLEPVGYPKIHFDNFAEDGEFKFTAEFEIRPEVELRRYEGLEVQKEIFALEDKAIEGVLENLRQSQTQRVPLIEDRALEMSDVAELDFVGLIDGAPIEHGSGEGKLLEIGSGRFIEGFEKGLVGMKIGDTRQLNLSFPTEYHNKDVAGRPVTFNVTLKGIQKKVVPELNDEFASKSGHYKSLAEFREAIRKDLEASEQKRIRDDLRNRLLKKLVNENPVEVPSGLLEQQKQMIVTDVQERMKQQGMGDAEFADYKQKWDKDFEQSAAFMVQSTFLVDAIADKLKLRAKPVDVEAKIDEYAKQTGIEREKVAEFYGRTERRSRLAFQITEERVVSYLLEKAKVQEVPKEKIEQA